MIKDAELQSLQSGHRERLRKKFLDGQLTNYEILELLLTYAIPRRDVRVLSRQLYKKYGNIQQLLAAPFESLMENDGIKENSAVFFMLIHKLMELDCKDVLNDAPIFHNYDKLIRYCKLLGEGKSVEEFHVLYLDSHFKLIKDHLHSSGTIDWAAVYIREIVKMALQLNAGSVLLVHNHPSKTAAFSSQDIEITTDLENALGGVSINLYDHILVAGDLAFSARNLQLLNKRVKTS